MEDEFEAGSVHDDGATGIENVDDVVVTAGGTFAATVGIEVFDDVKMFDDDP